MKPKAAIFTQLVQHHGGDRHVAKCAALAQDLRDEPAQAEGLVGVQQAVLALDQDRLAGPAGAELGLADQLDRGARQWVQDRNLLDAPGGLLGDAGDDDRVAVAAPGDQREHTLQRGELVPAQADGLGLEAQLGGHAHHQPAVGLGGL